MRFGKTLVIQEMDGVEPVLYPILRGDFISQGEVHLTSRLRMIRLTFTLVIHLRLSDFSREAKIYFEKKFATWIIISYDFKGEFCCIPQSWECNVNFCI